MKNLDKMKSLLESGEVDALLLTSEVSRHYAAQYNIAEGVAVVCKNRSYYFTDSRYIESAQNNFKNFEVIAIVTRGGYVACLNEAIRDFGVKSLGYEEDYITAGEFHSYEEALHAALKPVQKALNAFRASKEPWELDRMVKAQEITD